MCSTHESLLSAFPTVCTRVRSQLQATALPVAFLVELGLSFFVGYLTPELEVVTTPRDIARHYLTTRFVPNLVSSLPYNWFFASTWTDLVRTPLLVRSPFEARAIMEMLKVLCRLIRLVRGSRHQQIRRGAADSCLADAWRAIVSAVHPFAWTAIRHFLFFLLFAHILACFNYFLSIDATLCSEADAMSWAEQINATEGFPTAVSTLCWPERWLDSMPPSTRASSAGMRLSRRSSYRCAAQYTLLQRIM